MTTKQVINNFLNGETKGKASSIRIEGDRLFNYSTVIAQRINGVVYINVTRYSMTTSKHQNYIRRSLYNAPTLDNISQGCHDLSRYVKEVASNG